MTSDDRERLLQTLESRFREHPRRHPGIDWSTVEARLADDAGALRTLGAMEESGGEPDVVGRDGESGEILFVDCSKQSPGGRRSLCYDREARTTRKKHPPESSAEEVAAALGIELLTEEEYRRLQELGEFDTTTSSWIRTPDEVRRLGGALFCDRRYGQVFVYHNGADSYYAARGFRGALRV